MKVYKLEVLIIDFDELGEKEIKTVLENQHYPNWCIHPQVKDVKVVDIGEWTDGHPLNNKLTKDAEYQRLFPKE